MPKNEVIALIGNIVGYIIVLEKISAPKSKIAPINTDDNNKFFGDSKFNSLEIWGATRPINPIIPTIDTVQEASNEDINKNTTLSKFTFTPCITAFFSPCWIIPKSLENKREILMDINNIANRKKESFNEETVNEPVVQNAIW